MSGFFTDSEIAEATPAGCGHTCTLNRGASPLPVSGQGKRRILIITETPLGRSSSFLALAKVLHAAGVDAQRDCWITSAVVCPCARAPSTAEVTACRPNILRIIREHSPSVVLMFGPAAVASVVGSSNTKMAFGKGRGFQLLCDKIFPDQAFPGSWLAVVHSPDMVERQKFDPVVDVVWRKSIASAVEAADIDIPEPPDPDCCELVTDAGRAALLLGKVLHNKALIAFDYETTGLKPHRAGQRVVSVGFCPSFSRSYAFDIPARADGGGWGDVVALWREIMGNPAVPKVAHNVAFEWEWTRKFFKTVPRGFVADTQVLAHLEDSRPGHSGLKAQSYLKFGAPEYADETDRFKRPSPEDTATFGCNAMNRMDRAPQRARLKYNAVDALYCFWLFKWYQTQGLAAPAGSDYIVYG